MVLTVQMLKSRRDLSCYVPKRRSQDYHFHAGGGALVENRGDILLVRLQLDSARAVSDVVHAAGKRHPVRLLGKNTVETRKHLVRLVAADSCLDGGDFRPALFEDLENKIDVTCLAALSLLGDGVPEECDPGAVFDLKFCRRS